MAKNREKTQTSSTLSFKATAILGCRLFPGKVWKMVSRKTCEHDNPDQEKYCPVCGKIATVTEEVAPDVILAMLSGEVVKGLRIASPVGSQAIGRDEMYCGQGCSAHNVAPWALGAKFRTEDFDRVREQCRAFLDPLGLWEEEEFGVWLVVEPYDPTTAAR